MLNPVPEPTSLGLSSLGNTAGVTGLAGDRVVLAGGSNITLSGSVSAGSLTITVIGPDQLAVAGTSVFSNSNNVSFGTIGAGTVTASASFSQSSPAVSGSNGSFTFDTLTLGALNGLSFYTSNGSIVGSYTVPAGVVTAGLISHVNVSAGTTSNNLTALTFSNSNNVSFGLNGSTLTASASYSQSTAPGGLAAGTQTATSGTVVFANSNGLTFGMSGSSQVTGSYTVPSTAGLISAVNVSAGTTSNNLSALTFSNSNGLSFGLNGSTLTGSYTVPTVTNSSFTLSDQNTSLTIARLAFTGSNGLTLSLSTTTGGSATVVGSYTVPSTAGLISAVNVSAGTTSNNLSALTFSNANGVSFGLNGSTLTASHNALTSQSNPAFSASGGSSTFQTLGFSAQNGVTFTNTNGSVGVTHALQFTSNTSAITSNALNTSASRVMNVIAATNNTGGGTASLSSNVSFSNANGATFYTSAGNAVALSYTVPTVPAQLSVGQSTGGNTSGDTALVTGRLVIAGGNNITISGSTNGGSMTLTISGANIGGAQTGISGVQVSDTTYTSGTVTFRNANGISFGASGANGISASYTVPTVPAQFSGGVSTGGNTSGDTGAVTGRLVLAGGNNITISGSTNGGSITLTISGPNVGGAQTGISGIVVSDTTYTSGTVSFSNANGISFGSSAGQAITASYTVPSTAGLISAVNLSAGTTSNNLSAAVFSNSNNVSFGLNGSTVTATATFAQTNQSAIKAFGVSNTGQTAGNTGVSTGVDWVLAGSQSITLSQSTAGGGPNTVWLQHPAWLTTAMQSNAATISNIRVSAGTTSNLLSAVTFADSNGISFGLNASTVTASHNGLTSQSNQNVTAANGGFAFQTLSFSNANGFSFGTSAGSAITGSYTVPTQTNQSAGVYALGNTTGQSSSSTYDARTLSVEGAGIVSVGWSNSSLRISATQSNQAFSADASSTFQTLSFQNSNGVSFSNNAGALRVTHDLQFTSNTSNITSNALHTSASRVFNVVAATNNTGGGTASLSSNVSFSNANGATFYTSAGNAVALSYSVPTVPAQFSGGVSNLGATSGDTGVVTARMVLVGTNNITLSGSTNGGSITISISGNNAAAAVTGISGIQVSDATYTSGTVTFRNANGISFGASGANGISASYTVPTQTNQTLGLYHVGNTTGQSSSSTVDARSFTFSGAGNISVGMSGGSVIISQTGGGANVVASASNGSFSFTTLAFSNANNVTFGTSAGSIITASVAPPGAAAENNFQALLGANTSGNTTASGSTIGWSGVNLTLSGTNDSVIKISAPATSSLSATGMFSISVNGSTVSMGVATVQSLYATGNTTQGSSGTQDIRSLSFNGAGIVFVGVTNGSVVVSASVPSQTDQTLGLYAGGNTTLSTSITYDARTLTVVGSGHAFVGVSNGSLVVNAIQSMNSFVPMWPGSSQSQTLGAIGVTSARAFFVPFFLSDVVQFNCARVPHRFSVVTSNASGANTISSYWGLYSNNADTLSQISSGSLSLAYTGSSVSGTLSFPNTTDTAGYTYTTSEATATAQQASLWGTAGNRIFDLVFGNTMSLTVGTYWLGLMHRQSTANAAIGPLNAFVGNEVSPMVNAGLGIGVSTVAATTNFNQRAMIGMGVYTSTGSAGYGGTALPASAFLSGIAHTLTVYPLFTLASTR